MCKLDMLFVELTNLYLKIVWNYEQEDQEDAEVQIEDCESRNHALYQKHLYFDYDLTNE